MSFAPSTVIYRISTRRSSAPVASSVSVNLVRCQWTMLAVSPRTWVVHCQEVPPLSRKFCMVRSSRPSQHRLLVGALASIIKLPDLTTHDYPVIHAVTFSLPRFIQIRYLRLIQKQTMKTITLSHALKHKNRLAGEIARLREIVQRENSRKETQTARADVRAA